MNNRRHSIHAVLCGAVLAAACALPSAAAAQSPPTPQESAAYTGLFAAAARGDTAQIDKLVTGGRANLEERDSHGRTPLHVATFAKQRGAIRALVRNGANMSALDSERYDAVTIAAVANDEETLRVLLSLGADAGLTTSRYEGTALIAAAHLGNDGVVRQLIAAKAPLDHVNNLHWTAMIEAIVLGDGGPRHQNVLRALLDAGANTQLKDREGKTPLALAQARGYAEMVAMLEKAKAK